MRDMSFEISIVTNALLAAIFAGPLLRSNKMYVNKTCLLVNIPESETESLF